MATLPFCETLAKNLEELDKRVFVLNKASMIVIDGSVGEGKTTLAVHTADYFNKLHDKPPIALEPKNHPQLSMGGSEFTTCMRICFKTKEIILIYDEAGDFNKRGSISRFNQMLNRVFETYRGFRVVVILCLPCFDVLDNWLFLNCIPRLLLHCEKRGQKFGNYKGYSLYRMMYIRRYMKKFTIPHYAYTSVEPNFRGTFFDLAKERSEKLNILSITGKLGSLKKSEITLGGLLSYVALGEKLNRQHRWIRATAKRLNIRPVKVIDRVKYFDESALNRMIDYIDTLHIK